jgi:signal transduction histidine kinase
VFAEPVDGELFCSVKDDGGGFDPGATEEGTGLGRSVRGRIGEVGGRVEVDGRPGRGTEVRCWSRYNNVTPPRRTVSLACA